MFLEGSMNSAGLWVCFVDALYAENIVADGHLYTSVENRKY